MKKRLSGLLVCVLLVACSSGTDDLENQDLAYLAVSDGYWQVWVAESNGKNARQVTSSKNDKTRVDWFTDGKTLLVSFNDGRLMKVDVASGVETALLMEQTPVLDASVSPDGKQIAFSFSTAIDGNDLWIADANGSNAKRVARMAGLQHEPIWSVDGKTIYFLSGAGGQTHDIWKLDTESYSTEQMTTASLYHFDIAVTKKGCLAYSSNRTGNYEIFVECANAQAEQLTNDIALDAHPTFTAEGDAMIFESSRDGALNLWRLDLTSKALRKITATTTGARSPVLRRKGLVQ